MDRSRLTGVHVMVAKNRAGASQQTYPHKSFAIGSRQMAGPKERIVRRRVAADELCQLIQPRRWWGKQPRKLDASEKPDKTH